MSVGSLAARAVIGGLFIGHGTQKLFGWFGGPGPAGTEQMMTALEMHPAKRNAMAAGVTEAAGGALLAAGLATPAAAAGLIGVMITAVRKVHMKNGFWNANGGYEFNLVLIAALLAIVDKGPGKVSMDHAMGLDDTGTGWALAALATGVAASTLTIELARRSGPTTSSGVDQVPDDGEPYTDTAGDPVTSGT
jgi:putative oxidoreductase